LNNRNNQPLIEDTPPMEEKIDFRPGDELTIKKIREFVEVAKENTHLKTVIMEDAAIDDKKVKLLVELQNIKTLSVGSNNITDVGIKEIVEKMPNLETLIIYGNEISDEGVKHLANSCLLHIDLSGNGDNITDAGVGHFLNNTRIEKLILDGTSVSESLMEKINIRLQQNKEKAKNINGKNSEASQLTNPKTSPKIDLKASYHLFPQTSTGNKGDLTKDKEVIARAIGNLILDLINNQSLNIKELAINRHFLHKSLDRQLDQVTKESSILNQANQTLD
jgi:hypothetical protein